MTGPLTDAALAERLDADAAEGWRVFIAQYTPLILGRLDRAGVRDHDEKMEVYTLVCERLSANACARLRARRPQEGSLAAWLSVVVRHVVVDWVRSRAGRRRVFGSIRALSSVDQRVFELFYWEERRVSEIAGQLSTTEHREVSVFDVLDSLGRVNAVLSERHRSDLISTAFRARHLEPLESADGGLRVDRPSESPSPEAGLLAADRRRQLESALAMIPVEDAAIIRLHFENGLTLAQVRIALRLPELGDERFGRALAMLRSAMERCA